MDKIKNLRERSRSVIIIIINLVAMNAETQEKHIISKETYRKILQSKTL
jgi:hypothetical protein